MIYGVSKPKIDTAESGRYGLTGEAAVSWFTCQINSAKRPETLRILASNAIKSLSPEQLAQLYKNLYDEKRMELVARAEVMLSNGSLPAKKYYDFRFALDMEKGPGTFASNKNPNPSKKVPSSDHPLAKLDEFYRFMISLGADLIPGVGDVKSVQESILGKDYITEEKIGPFGRALALLGAIPFVPGTIKDLGKGADKALAHALKEEATVGTSVLRKRCARISLNEVYKKMEGFLNISEESRAQLELLLKRFAELKISAKSEDLVYEVEEIEEILFQFMRVIDCTNNATIKEMTTNELKKFMEKIKLGNTESLNYVQLERHIKGYFGILSEMALDDARDLILKRAPSKLKNEISADTGPLTRDKIEKWNKELNEILSEKNKTGPKVNGNESDIKDSQFQITRSVCARIQKEIREKTENYAKKHGFETCSDIEDYIEPIIKNIKNYKDLEIFLKEIGFDVSRTRFFGSIEYKKSYLGRLFKWIKGLNPDRLGNHLIRLKNGRTVYQLGDAKVRILIDNDGTGKRIIAIGQKDLNQDEMLAYAENGFYD